MANKSILALGLVLPPSPQAPAMQAAVGAAISDAKEAGYHVEMHAIDITNVDHIEAFRDYFKKHSWDAVLIGWGIRGNPEHTGLFEELVNIVATDQQPAPRFIFSLKPDEMMDGIRRVFEDGI